MKFKLKLSTALAVLVALLVPAVAGAHVEVTPSEVPAGKKVNLALEVGHGCDGEATTSLTVLMPKGIENYAAGAVDGWKQSNPPRRMVWTGGPLPDHEVKQFPFTAKLYGKKGSELVFKILQNCEGGASTAWIQQAPAGGAEPEHPASVLTLTSSAQPPEGERAPATETGSTGDDAVQDMASAGTTETEKGEDEDDGGGFILPLIGIVLIAASVTAFVVIQRGKKNQP